MPFYEKGAVRIHYEEAGSGFPVLFIPGGGLNSNISFLTGFEPFNCMEEFRNEYRCITMDLRNANGGQSSGPVEVERPWDSYTDDQLGLMDYLGCKEFMVMGFCIGGPFIWNLLKLRPIGSSQLCWHSPVDRVRKYRTCSTTTTSKAGARNCARAGQRSRWRRSMLSSRRCISPIPTSSSP